MKYTLVLFLIVLALSFSAVSCSVGDVEPIESTNTTDTSQDSDTSQFGNDLQKDVQQNWPSGGSGTDCNDPSSPGYQENCQ